MNQNIAGDIVSVRIERPDGALAGGASAARTVAGIASAILAVALVGLYWREAAGAVAVWYGTPTYNHGFLIVPIVAYLIWERRAALAGRAPETAPSVLALIPILGVVWLVARLAGLLEGQQFAVMAMLQVALVAILGRRFYGVLRFPLLFLFFLVPSGAFLTPALQDFTARFVVGLLRLGNIPVYSDGYLIAIPSNNFYVAEACAGLRFLIAMTALGFLFADFAFRSLSRKAAFIALCVATPIVANGLRAYGIIAIAYLTDGRIAVGVDHIVYGWLFFALVSVGPLAVAWHFRDRAPARRERDPGTVSPASPRRILAVAAAALCLAALPRAYAALLEGSAGGGPVDLVLPVVAAPWTREAVGSDWHPRFPAADQTVRESFRNNRRRVDLVIAYYRRQGDDKKLVGGRNSLVGTSDAEVSARGAAEVTIDGAVVPVAATRISAPHQDRLVFSFYWVDGRFTSSALGAKLLQIRAALIDRRQDSAVVALSTEDDDPAGAAVALREFAAHLGPLAAALDAAGVR
jgi:exosortase A